jgi:ankyrin repeat protein
MRAVEYLLSIENTKRRFDRDALSYAVYFGPVTTVKLVAQHILDRCRSWEERVEVYSAALSWSLRRHDLSTNDEAARYLVEELPDKHLVGMGPKYIITAIHHGACVKLIKHLIDKGADVNTSSPSHLEVPLEAAINRGDEEIIRLLLDSRAKCTPQALCRASTSTEEILDLVFSYYVYRDIDLYQCVTLGNAAVVKRLLTFGKNPNPSTGSANALQMAVLRGSLDIAKMLLEAGANPNHFVDNFMEGAWGTPLYIATSHSNIPLVKLLLHHGADTTCCSHWRRKPILHVNVGQGPMPVIKVLVDYDHS